MRVTIVSIFMVLGVFSHSVMGIEVREFFEGTKKDLLKTWNFCQADFANLIDVEDKKLKNTIDAVRKGPEECKSKVSALGQVAVDEPDEADPLGPSFITPLTASPSKEGESCAEEVLNDGETITQRNELRFLPEDRLRHDFIDPHWYAIRFKMDGDIPTCGSVRWVTAQWKYEVKKWDDPLPKSPFLAQRYDNGVLHITVQNGHCRCMVAKASGDPNRKDKKVPLSIDEPVPEDEVLMKVDLPGCKWSKKEKKEELCFPDEEKLSLWAKRAEDLYELPNPKDKWVRMAYWIKGANGPNRVIDVWADGHFVVRIKGMVGYPSSDPQNVKFKFGAYRDKFRFGAPRNSPPENAHMLVDEICVTKSKDKAVSGCR